MRREGWGSAAGLCALPCLAAGCSGGSQGGGGGGLPQPATLSAKALAGEALFHDSSLSASGRPSCVSCHVPERAFSADPLTDRRLPVPLGGRNMDLPGFRNAPSLVYAALTPHFFIDEGTPTGGFFRDGRASSLAVQGQQPFVSEFEMAVNIGEIPYTAPRFAGGQSPTLDAQEIDDLVAFLCTLTDGYGPKNPGAYNVPARCLPGAQ